MGESGVTEPARDTVVAGHWEQVDTLRIFTRAGGVGPTTVFLHGIPTSSFVWRDVLPQVAPARRVIAPDLPGFGCSDRPRYRPYTVVSWADAVARLLDQIGVARYALVGHDLGALVATELVRRDPTAVSALVLTNTSLRPAGWHGFTPLALLRFPILGELGVALARRWMLRAAMRVYVSEDRRLTRSVMDGYWWPFEHGFRDVLLALYRSPIATAAEFDRWRAALTAYRGRTLLAWGMRDPTFGAELEDVAALLPDAAAVPFVHANHFIQEDRPEALGRLIAAFLAGAELPRAVP